MARVNNLNNFLTDVASAIKQKTGDNTPIPASEFDAEILSIETGGNYQSKTLNITQNGNYNLLPDTGYDAMDQVAISVDVPTEEPMEPTTAVPDDVLSPKTFYSNGEKMTGRITSHKTPLGETLDINSSFIDTISNYDTCINNQNIVCKYNSSGYITFYKADIDNQTLTLLYITDLSEVYFTMSDCYYGLTDNEYDILLVTKNKSNDTIKGQTFNTYILKVRDTITFEALTEKDLVISDYYYGRLYSTMSNGIWYVFLAYSSYNTYSSSEAYCMYQIYQADYSFDGTLNYIKKSNSNIYTGRIATQYCYLTGMNISTLENGTHIVVASSCSNSGYNTLMRVAASVFSSDFSTKLYSSNSSTFWPSSGSAYYGGICTIGKYIVSVYTSDSSSNVYTVRVHEFASDILTLKSTQTITIPTDLIGGAPNNSAMFHVLGSYGICLFKRNSYYGFVFTINNSGEFVIGENLMNGGSEYETFAIRNQNSNSFLDLKTWSIRVNANGQRLDNLNVGNKTLYNTDDTNALAENILNSKTAYINEGKVTGTMPNNGALSYTPSTSQQTIPAGYTSGGTIGAVTSSIDSNIIAQNIKKDISILGVTGTLEEGEITLEVTGENVDITDTTLIFNNVAPESYIELEYIQSTGNQFIEVDYIPKTLHTKYELGYLRTAANATWSPIINSENDVRFGIMATTDGSTKYTYGQFHIGGPSDMQNIKFPISDNVQYDMIADKTGISINGVKYPVSGTVVDATGSWSTCINHRRISATEYSNEYSLGKWYYVKIYEDDVLIRDLIPAKRKSDNAIGMYDKVSNRFFINQGTGSFTAGPEVGGNE